MLSFQVRITQIFTVLFNFIRVIPCLKEVNSK